MLFVQCLKCEKSIPSRCKCIDTLIFLQNDLKSDWAPSYIRNSAWDAVHDRPMSNLSTDFVPFMSTFTELYPNYYCLNFFHLSMIN